MRLLARLVRRKERVAQRSPSTEETPKPLNTVIRVVSTRAHLRQFPTRILEMVEIAEKAKLFALE